MSVLLLLLPISALLMAVAAAIFIWAVNDGQFEELDRHGFDVLDDPAGDDPR
jgi:cbb3-type cytochrome oxidase maturation protein